MENLDIKKAVDLIEVYVKNSNLDSVPDSPEKDYVLKSINENILNKKDWRVMSDSEVDEYETKLLHYKMDELG